MSLFRKAHFAFNEFRENYDDRFWRSNRVSDRVLAPFHRRFLYSPEDCVWVMEEDWDNLIILDACRTDLFEEVVKLDRFDDYRRVVSPGGATDEWTFKNFTGKEFGDTVYVTANGVTSKVAPAAFHDLIEVWDDADEKGRPTQTLWPDGIPEQVAETNDRYADKRLIVHFVQPHVPFLRHPELCYAPSTPAEIDSKGPDSEHPNVWAALARGEVTREEVWEGYVDNLELVLDYAFDIAENLEGKTVISSDHGNMVGERGWPVPVRLYGHHNDLRCKELVEVPWAVINSGGRRSITDDGARHRGSVDHEVVDQRLRMLGYKENFLE